jgi:hypothetical protein
LIAASNSQISSGLKFGVIYFDEKYGKNMENFTGPGLSSNIFYRGVNFQNKKEEKKQIEYIQIGCI